MGNADEKPVKYWNEATRMCVVRAGRQHHRLLLEAMQSPTSVKSHSCAWEILHVAGSIRSCQKALFEHNNALVRRHSQKVKQAMEDALAGAEEDDSMGEGSGEEEFLAL